MMQSEHGPSINALRALRLALAALALLGLGIASAADKKEEKPTMSADVIKVYKPAKEAADKGDYDTAMTLSRQILAMPNLKPYDREVGANMLRFAAAKKSDFMGFAEATEILQTLDSTTPEDRVKNYDKLTRIYYQSKMYDKAVDNGKKWLDAGGGTDAFNVLSQIYLSQSDCAAYLALQDQAPAGTPVSEAGLTNRVFCNKKLGTTDKIPAIADEIFSRFPTAKYYAWERDYGRIDYAANKTSEVPLLNVYRFGFAHDDFESAKDYNDYAEFAMAQGNAEEAQVALERGVERKLVSADVKTNKLLSEVRRGAADDKKGLAALDKEARAGTSGLKDIAVASSYFGLGQYPQAAEALERGLSPERIAKVKHADDAYMMLGITYLKLDRRADAEKAFAAVQGDHIMSALAKAWLTASAPPPAAAAAPDAKPN
jgi:tetratricopeptide (TPR) repeat protein